MVMIKRLWRLASPEQEERQAPQCALHVSGGKSSAESNGQVSGSGISDRRNPADVDDSVRTFVSAEMGRGRLRSVSGIAAVLVVLFGLAAAWYWTPLNRWVDIKEISSLAAGLRENPLAPLAAIAAFTIGGLVMFPATLLIVATAVTFEPFIAFLYSLLGCLSSAIALFCLGHWVGRETVHRLVGTRLNRLSSALNRRGLITVITVRVFPVAPYSVVNFVAGVSPIRFRDYVVGTVIGLIPGVSAVTIFGVQLENALVHPGMETLLALVGVLTLISLANVVIHRWFDSKSTDSAEEQLLER
jgi:phospholipase D1/2